MYEIRDQQRLETTGTVDWDSETPFGGRQLLVVSNRQPYRHNRSDDGDISVDRPTGGLTASLDPVMQRLGGTWVAWGDGDGDKAHVDESDRVSVPLEDPSYTLRRVWLSEEQVQNYYYGFSNRILWPLCHSSLSTVRSEQSYWEQYQQTNEQFAEIVSTEADDRSVIWLQDYHFALAPSYIRDNLGKEALLMHFWHIPWPSWDIYRACPHGAELLDSLLANDMIGFHVDRYCHNFLECVDATLQDATINWRTGTVSYRGEKTRVKSIPMGVPFEDIQNEAKTYDSTDFSEFRESYDIDEDTRIAVGVDRLDYTKGIPERLKALELLWERRPEWRGSLTHVLNRSESRSQISVYQKLQKRVAENISRINKRFGMDDWQPIVEVSEYLSQRELYGLYRHSDICLVSPIRDGLNLIPQEYVAAQVDGNGALLLSRQAGAYDILGDSAISISPFNTRQFADSIDEALSMPQQKRKRRMEQMRRTVAENNLETWIEKNATVAFGVTAEREISSTST